MTAVQCGFAKDPHVHLCVAATIYRRPVRRQLLIKPTIRLFDSSHHLMNGMVFKTHHATAVTCSGTRVLLDMTSMLKESFTGDEENGEKMREEKREKGS